MCLCLSFARARHSFLSLSVTKKETHIFRRAAPRVCVCVCDTCYEVTARRGLRNNPSKINISKPHLCVWLNVQSQFPLLSFYARPMPNLTKIAFTQRPKVCVCIHTVTYLKLHNCFGKLLIFLHRAVIRLSTHIWHTLTHSPHNTRSGLCALKSKWARWGVDNGWWKFQTAIKTINLVHFHYVGGGTLWLEMKRVPRSTAFTLSPRLFALLVYPTMFTSRKRRDVTNPERHNAM